MCVSTEVWNLCWLCCPALARRKGVHLSSYLSLEALFTLISLFNVQNRQRTSQVTHGTTDAAQRHRLQAGLGGTGGGGGGAGIIEGLKFRACTHPCSQSRQQAISCTVASLDN